METTIKDNYSKRMLDEMAENSIYYESIDYIFENVRSLPPIAVDILLKWLPYVYDESLSLGDMLVKSLIGVKEPFNPKSIINLFENDKYHEVIKSGIAFALAKAKTLDISDWIKDQLINKPVSFEKVPLIYALETKAKINSSKELMEILKQLFDKYIFYENYQKIFQRHALKNDIPFLEKKMKGSSSRKELIDIRKIIKHIEKKKNMPVFPKP